MGKIIGFDASRAFVKGRTGTENYSFELLKALAKTDKKNQYIIYVRPDSVASVILTLNLIQGKDINLKLYSSGRSDPQNDNTGLYRFPTKSGMTGEEWPENFLFKLINWPRFWTQGGLALQTFKDNLDVLFVPAHTLPLVRKPGLKTVVTVHDLGSEYLPSMHQFKQRLYLGFMQKVQLKTATKIVSVSKATKEDLIKRLGIEEKKISVIYEGFDNKLFKPVKNEILVNVLRQYDIDPGKYFLFVGTVQPRKNLERLIKAFAKIPARQSAKNKKSLTGLDFAALKLVLVGSKGWLSEEIYALPKKLGIEDRVKFLGYVPDQDLPALYKGAIALTYPSLFEGFGLPILEAQACGCPVLTSSISSMPEVAGRGALYVNPYDIDDIVEGMGRVKREAERGKLIKAGVENIKRFSWEKCARETLKVLETV